MKPRYLLASLALATFFAARPAAADGMVTANVGRVFSGDVDEGQTSYGAAIGFMGGGVFGFEVEGTYTPDFFGDTDNGAGNNNVTWHCTLLVQRVGT